MDPAGRTASEHLAMRFEGARRRIAMRESDWQALQTQISLAVFLRLRAAFRRFCEGCDNLPTQVFCRVDGDPHGRLEQFIADGVQVIGRRGTDETLQTFFTTEVRIAARLPLVEPAAPSQAMLPLVTVLQQKGTER